MQMVMTLYLMNKLHHVVYLLKVMLVFTAVRILKMILVH